MLNCHQTTCLASVSSCFWLPALWNTASALQDPRTYTKRARAVLWRTVGEPCTFLLIYKATRSKPGVLAHVCKPGGGEAEGPHREGHPKLHSQTLSQTSKETIKKKRKPNFSIFITFVGESASQMLSAPWMTVRSAGPSRLSPSLSPLVYSSVCLVFKDRVPHCILGWLWTQSTPASAFQALAFMVSLKDGLEMEGNTWTNLALALDLLPVVIPDVWPASHRMLGLKTHCTDVILSSLCDLIIYLEWRRYFLRKKNTLRWTVWSKIHLNNKKDRGSVALIHLLPH